MGKNRCGRVEIWVEGGIIKEKKGLSVNGVTCVFVFSILGQTHFKFVNWLTS